MPTCRSTASWITFPIVLSWLSIRDGSWNCITKVDRHFVILFNKKKLRINVSFPVSATHRETKQFYTLYNTLDDTKLYLEKEMSLLNSIYENYGNAMQSFNSREQFVQQFETIVDGIRNNKTKVGVVNVPFFLAVS